MPLNYTHTYKNKLRLFTTIKNNNYNNIIIQQTVLNPYKITIYDHL